MPLPSASFQNSFHISDIDRLIIANQLRIRKMLGERDSHDRWSFDSKIQILEHGYIEWYSLLSESSAIDKVPLELVHDPAYEGLKLADRLMIIDLMEIVYRTSAFYGHSKRFVGVDNNGRFFGYVYFLVNSMGFLSGVPVTDLQSHGPDWDYPKMVNKWQQSVNMYELTDADIKRIGSDGLFDSVSCT